MDSSLANLKSCYIEGASIDNIRKEGCTMVVANNSQQAYG